MEDYAKGGGEGWKTTPSVSVKVGRLSNGEILAATAR